MDDDNLNTCGQAHTRRDDTDDPGEVESFIVVRWGALISRPGCPAPYTLTHEFGHSFGISHENRSLGFWRSWSRAIEVDTPAVKFTSVTARYDTCCSKKLRFSNPNQSISGHPLGSQSRNGALTIQQTAGIIADFWVATDDWIDLETRYTNQSHYYSLAEDGRVRPHNGAPYYGAVGEGDRASPIVGMAADPDGYGYWLVDEKGCLYRYSAPDFNDMCGIPLNEPIVGIEEYKGVTGNNRGYWMVASDGGIFSFGSAAFKGSMGGIPLNSPMVGMARVPGGTGYWTVAADGGIFSFGGAPFHGSLGATPPLFPVTGMDTTAVGGYWLFDKDGEVYDFGNLNIEGQLPIDTFTGSAVNP
jgi:hypothetical protein